MIITKWIFSVFVLGLLSLPVHGQYDIFVNNRPYIPLSENAYSICFENNYSIGNYEKLIDLEFEFPFWGKLFHSILVNGDSNYFISDPEDGDYFDAYLFDIGYQNKGHLQDSLISDWKYDFVTNEAENRCLVLEWSNVSGNFEQFFYGTDHHFFNFQTWFCEDGTISVHFGESDVDAMNLFKEGIGSFLIFQGDTTYSGPWIDLYNPDNPDEYIGIGWKDGEYFSYNEETVNDDSFFPYVPESGTEVGFRPKTNNTLDLIKSPSFSVMPNPFNSEVILRIKDYPKLEDRFIFTATDVFGRVALKKTFQYSGQDYRIPTSEMNEGIYIFSVYSENRGDLIFAEKYIKY